MGIVRGHNETSVGIVTVDHRFTVVAVAEVDDVAWTKQLSRLEHRLECAPRALRAAVVAHAPDIGIAVELA